MSQKNVAANYQLPLSLCHINIMSMNRNFQSFQQYLAVLNFEFAAIGVSETWLTERNHDLYSHTGYTFTERHINDRLGGGVGLFLKGHIDYTVMEDLIFCDIMESSFVEIPGSEFKMEKNIILGIIFRPPGTDLNQFSDLFGNILEIEKEENKFCYLLGDYNINPLNFETHGPTSEFADLLYANSFIPLINRPTRVTQFSATLINNILTNNFQDIHKSTQGIRATEISDHFPIFHINWNVCVNKNDVYIASRCKVIEIDRISHSQLLKLIGRKCIINNIPSKLLVCYTKKLSNLYYENFHKRRVKLKYNNKKPWLSEGLWNALKQNIYI